MAVGQQKRPKAPPAPPAPGVGARVNQQNQGSTVANSAAAAQKRMGASGGATPGGGVSPRSANGGGASPGKGPTGGVKPGNGPQGRFGGKRKTPLEKQQERERRRRERERNQNSGTTTNQAPDTPGETPPVAPYDPPPDPRTPEYWANRTALEAQYGVQFLMLQNEQDVADERFDRETRLQNEYQRRRQRDLAEARLGTGSAYTGSARDERFQDNVDFAIEQDRRTFEKRVEDNQRKLEKMGIEADQSKAIAGLDQEYVDKLTNALLNESETSAGDREYTPDYSNQIKALTNQIQKLQAQLKKVNDPQKRAQIQSKIEKLKKQRTNIQGKARNSG